MTTDTAIIEKREELKRRLVAGEYKTLVDVIFDWISRAVQKVTRDPRPISPWFSSIILVSFLWLLAFTVLNIMRDAPNFTRQLAAFPRGTLLVMAFLTYITLLIVVVGNLFVHRVFRIFQVNVIDAIESTTTLNDFENWLANVSDWKAHFLVSLTGGVLSGGYVLYTYSATFKFFLPISIAFGFLVFYIMVFVFLYQLLFMAVLSARIGGYHLKLFTADPSNSELIAQLANLFSRLVYLGAIYAAFFVFVIAYLGLLIQYIIMLIILFWIPLIIMFALYQGSLSSIVRRAKWKTLRDIQQKVEDLQEAKNFGDKETIESVNRLMDYHDRIASTRNSALDLRSTLNFVNSLLLPLLAFVLGNLDLVLNLFVRKP